jgi:HK97 family phage major capsid protein
MPPAELNADERELVVELRRSVRDEVDNRIAPLRRQLLEIGQRSSRAPGASPEHAAFDGPNLSGQLLGDAGFQAFAKSVLTKNSSYAVELRLPPSRKATPISGISPTEYLPQRIWGVAQFPLRLRQILPTLMVGSGTIEYTQETSFTPSATVVPETLTKPSMAISFAEAISKVATVASIVKVSRQSLMDVPLMNVWLNVRLTYSVNLKEEDVLINGDSANGIPGLLQLATPFTYTPLATDQQMDAIAHAIGALMGKGYAPDGVILNAADYTAMRLLKTTIGSYIAVPVPAGILKGVLPVGSLTAQTANHVKK